MLLTSQGAVVVSGNLRNSSILDMRKQNRSSASPDSARKPVTANGAQSSENDAQNSENDAQSSENTVDPLTSAVNKLKVMFLSAIVVVDTQVLKFRM